MSRALPPLVPLCAALLAGCVTAYQSDPVDAPTISRSRPPIAERIPRTTVVHGERRTDDYAWLRYRQYPAVTDYLMEENAFTEAVMARTKPLQDRLYAEMLGRIQETDQDPPERLGGYLYYSRTEEGKPYEVHCRRRGDMGAPEEVLLDENAMAGDSAYFAVANLRVSPSQRNLAFALDTTGAEHYTLRFKNLETGELSAESIPDTTYSLAWATDSATVFYTTMDETDRPDTVWRHTVGADPAGDVAIYNEPDPKFYVSVHRSRSGRFIFITTESADSSEWRCLPADHPDDEPRLIRRREPRHEYSVEHLGDRFYIVTNKDAVNFRLVSTPVGDASEANWTQVIPHRADAMVVGVRAFEGRLVVMERQSGLPALRVLDPAGGDDFLLALDGAAYGVALAGNPEFNTAVVRYVYSSPVTPPSVFDFDMARRERTLVKETPVLGGYDRSRYAVERTEATAPDGTRVPISLVYRTPLKRNGSRPMLLEGYGSYGLPEDAVFSSGAVSLLDRGFVVGIAHVRGGGELGRAWFEQGRLSHKPNTFTDFIACAEHLVREKYTSPKRLAIIGGSAGGMLMGACANLRPDLFRVIVADVPFVDVLNTMLDPSIPLTTAEYEQWGNPTDDPGAYATIRSYAPYENVRAQRYPHILVTAGLNDPRVPYWEAAKWVAKLRATRKGNSTILLKTNMGSGHGGASDRYESISEDAFRYAFILDRLGLAKREPDR